MLPCMRPQDLCFEHETPIVLENRDGTEDRYECRIEFDVAPDDAVYIRQVDVWCGSPEHGRWQDAARVEDPIIAASLLDKARQIDLLDTVMFELEDKRAEQAKDDWLHGRDLADDNADSLGHAHRERIAERAR